MSSRGLQHLPPAATEEGSAGEGGHRVTLGVCGLELVLPQEASQKCSQNIRGTCEVQCEPDQGQPQAGRLQGTRQWLPQPRVDKDSQVVSGPNWRKVHGDSFSSRSTRVFDMPTCAHNSCVCGEEAGGGAGVLDEGFQEARTHACFPFSQRCGGWTDPCPLRHAPSPVTLCAPSKGHMFFVVESPQGFVGKGSATSLGVCGGRWPREWRGLRACGARR